MPYHLEFLLFLSENSAKQNNNTPKVEIRDLPFINPTVTIPHDDWEDVWSQIADRCRHHGRHGLLLPLPQTEIWEDKEKIKSGRFDSFRDNINFQLPQLATGFRVRICYGWWLNGRKEKNVTGSGQMKRKWIWELCVTVCGYTFGIFDSNSISWKAMSSIRARGKFFNLFCIMHFKVNQ